MSEDGLHMNNHWKEILGNSLSTIGTIQAAIGSTPQFHLNQNQSYQWRLIGNVLQALGSALSADGQGSLLWKDLEIIFKLSVIQRLLPDCCFMAHLIQKQNKK